MSFDCHTISTPSNSYKKFFLKGIFTEITSPYYVNELNSIKFPF